MQRHYTEQCCQFRYLERILQREVKVTTAKYYLRPNGSAVINLPQGFDLGLERGEELVAKWDGSRLILVPLKKVKFE